MPRCSKCCCIVTTIIIGVLIAIGITAAVFIIDDSGSGGGSMPTNVSCSQEQPECTSGNSTKSCVSENNDYYKCTYCKDGYSLDVQNATDGGHCVQIITSTPLDQYLDITSSVTFFFTAPGQTAQLTAVVRKSDGSSINNAPLSFSSSNPDAVSVDNNGLLTAKTANATSATITVHSGSTFPVVALAAVVKLAEKAILLDQNDIQEYNNQTEHLVLKLNAKTSTITTENVLVSGEFAVKPTSIRPIDGQRLDIDGVIPIISEAFDSLNIHVEGPATTFEVEASVDGDEVGIIPLDPGTGATVNSIQKHTIRSEVDRKLVCKPQAGNFSVGVKWKDYGNPPAHMGPKLSPYIDLVWDKWHSTLPTKFVAGTKASVGAWLDFGSITFSPSYDYAGLDCSLPLAKPQISIGNSGLAVNIDVGFEFEAGVKFGQEFKYTFPKADFELKYLAGVELSEKGFTPITKYKVVRTLTPGYWNTSASFSLEAKLGLKFKTEFSTVKCVEFFLKLMQFGAVSHFSLTDAFVGAEASLKLENPIDPASYGYKGPSYEVCPAVGVSVQPFKEQVGKALGSLRDFFGAGDSFNLDFKTELFKWPGEDTKNSVCAVSPKLELQAKAARGDAVAVSVQAAPNTRPLPPGTTTSFVTFADQTGLGAEAGSRTKTDSNGQVTTEWNPQQPRPAEVRAHLYDGLVGALFPYASPLVAIPPAGAQVPLTLVIEPNGISNGNVGQTYTFTLKASGLPASTSTVRFEWTMGDGVTTGTANATAANGQSTTEIKHAYKANNAYSLVAAAYDGPNQLATVSVIANIGQVQEERAKKLDVCDEWQVANQGGFGGTVDNWDISTIPPGRVFDLKFDTFNVPDKLITEYEGQVRYDSGWRGEASYNGDALYPGGVVGEGSGAKLGMFAKVNDQNFKLTLLGPDPGTEWSYSVRCREVGIGINACDFMCGAACWDFASPRLGNTCADCGYANKGDCMSNSTCKNLWNAMESFEYCGDDNKDIELDNFCTAIGCM